MKISFLSDIGRVRTNNQDYTQIFYNQNAIPLVLLADGMGGHKAGDVASKTSVETIGEKWQETDFVSDENLKDWLSNTIQNINEMIFNQGLQKEFDGMGTTLEAVTIFKQNFFLAHVGDSRAYFVHNKKMSQLTIDHSLVNEMYLAGELTKEEAKIHPQKNIITRSIGMPGDLKIDFLIKNFVAGDALLLATDGLTNMITDEEILQVINQQEDLEIKVAKLIRLANEKGGQDNITVSLVEFEEGD